MQKYLAAQGVASRRAAEKLIAEGRVKVNGRVVDTMGYKLDGERDRVAVDGVLLGKKAPRLRYILLNKPCGYICSAHDQRGRRTVLDLLHGVEERVYPVGRLDYDTAGLLLLTNDGELTHKLLHPSQQVDKTYIAEVAACPDGAALRRLREGVMLSDGLTAPAKVQVMKRRDDKVMLELTIHEGRNRQVRRMLDAVGCPVLRLKRAKLAFLDIKDVPLGAYRELSAAEIKRLKSL